MTYRVIEHFTDSQDNNRPYYPGDVFPRSGFSVSEARLAELAGCDNRRFMPLIARDAGENKTEDGNGKPTPPKRRKR